MSPEHDVEVEERDSDRLHRGVQIVLRLGLAVSVLLMASGSALRMAHGLDDAPSVRLFSIGETHDVGLLLGAAGILVLALTPALRVVALVVLWARQRDFRFVWVALVVLATLATSVALGKG